MRADSAGCTNGLLIGCRAGNVAFAVVARRSDAIHAALLEARVTDPGWRPALTQSGERRKGAAVIELTDRVDLSKLPAGTRLMWGAACYYELDRPETEQWRNAMAAAAGAGTLALGPLGIGWMIGGAGSFMAGSLSYGLGEGHCPNVVAWGTSTQIIGMHDC